MTSRRNFLRTAGGALLGAAAVSKAAQGAVPEAPIQTKPDMQPPLSPPNGRPYNPVATLNGTLTAITRTIVAILETHQQADGSVRLPKALQPYFGGLEVLEPVKA